MWKIYCCKACNWVGGQLPCWVHRRVICWGLEPGFPLSLILHKYLLLIQTILLNLIKGLWIMIKSRAFIFSLFFHPFRESDVLPSPKTKIFPSILSLWNSIFYIESKFIFASDVAEELYQSVRQFSGYFTTELYFYKHHVQWSVSVSH